ncbi:MAG: hypothetical protein IJD60_08690 [Clostridia bacterium]|nr:hypothetical protein [Clostridia bacterium]
MKYYTQADFDQNRAEKRRAFGVAALFALPPFALAVAAFALRIQPLCMFGCAACGSMAILLWDLKVKPALRYGRFLNEVTSGMSHQTLGTLVRVSEDLTYEEGVDFNEVILNIYEDLAEEGERRFLLDSKKEMARAWIGKDVVVTSHGNMVLEAQLYVPGQKEAQA